MLLCLTSFTVSLQAMDEPKELARKEMGDLEYEQGEPKSIKIAASDTKEEITTHKEISHLMGLPSELHVCITALIGDPPNLIEALNSIKSLACVPKHFNGLLNDHKNIYNILESLEKRFHRSIQ